MRFDSPTVTKHLIIINAIVFLGTQLNPDFMIGTFAMFYPASRFFHPWQPVTYMFMHAKFLHIFFNMYSLYLFGSILERTMGSRKFAIFYFLCGLGAVALHMGIQALEFSVGNSNVLNTPVLGASGAIYGLFVGYAMLYPNNVLSLFFPPVSMKAKWMMLIFVGMELLIGVFQTSDGVAHFAHLGGALVGVLLLLFWRRTGRLWDRDRWI